MSNALAIAVATSPPNSASQTCQPGHSVAGTGIETTHEDHGGSTVPVVWESALATDCEVTDVTDASGANRTIGVKPTFEIVLERHQTEIFRYAMQLTRNPTDADDLYQETMLKAYRAYGRLDGDANVRAWIYRIATNTFLSDRRKHGRVDLLDDLAAQAIPAAQTDHAAGLDARALLQEVAVFIDGLPPKQRVALTLRKHHELGYPEIAETLRCSEAAARASVHEALRKLRDCFGDRL